MHKKGECSELSENVVATSLCRLLRSVVSGPLLYKLTYIHAHINLYLGSKAFIVFAYPMHLPPSELSFINKGFSVEAYLPQWSVSNCDFKSLRYCYTKYAFTVSLYIIRNLIFFPSFFVCCFTQ